MKKFQVKREKRIEQYNEIHKGIDKKYIIATTLLEDIWINIDWGNMNKGRRLKIWDEFENQVKALSKCYSKLEPFIDKLCKRFGSFIRKYQTKEVLIGEHEDLLEIFRNETQIPMLILRLRREKNKQLNKENEKNKDRN
jgi:hypothetical protein